MLGENRGNGIMRKIQILLVAGVILLLQACATLTQSECETADWRGIGFEDGAEGRLVSYVSRHRKSCAEYGISPDLARYREGHAQGVAEYCTPENGFVQGNRGREYNGVCPSGLDDAFLFAYEQGLELHRMREAIRDIENEIIDAEVRLDEMAEALNQLEKRLVSGEGNADQRQAWLREFKSLQSESDLLETNIHDLEHEMENLQYEYELANSRVRY